MTDRHAPGIAEDDWRTLQFAPLWVFGLVAGADGKITRKEIDVLERLVRESATLRGRLVREVLVSTAVDFDTVMAAFGEAAVPFDEGLPKVAEVLERVPRDEAVMFKGTLVGLAAQVAFATRGGLHLHRETAEERAALLLLASFLGFDADEAEEVAGRYEGGGEVHLDEWLAPREGTGGYM